MLKRVCVAAVCAALLGGAAIWAWPREAHCAYCTPKLKCIDSSLCGDGCVCFKQGNDTFGQCVSFN